MPSSAPYAPLPPWAATTGPRDASIVLCGETVKIQLSNGMYATIDIVDLELVAKYQWYMDFGTWTSYAKTDQIPGRPRLHILLMQPAKGLVVNHIDRNGLNCRRNNMENVTQSVNTRKSALRSNKNCKYRGVYFQKDRNKFSAEITINYKKTHLGSFKTAEEAALAYNNAVLTLLGEGFPLNVF